MKSLKALFVIAVGFVAGIIGYKLLIQIFLAIALPAPQELQIYVMAALIVATVAVILVIAAKIIGRSNRQSGNQEI